MVDDILWLEWGMGEDVFLYDASGSDIAEILNPLYEYIEYEPDSDLEFLKNRFLPAFKTILKV